jgi:RHS repeat-associated protein
MTSLTAYGGSETRTYDANTLQLTGMQVPGALDLSYVYPAAGSNNGRISAETNNLTNTQVSYTYDQLNRLATAVSATGGTTNWGLGFSYDVYGNRTAQTVTAGSAPAFSATFGSNNRMVGYSYDNNGNQLNTADGATLEYDEENRLKKWTKQGQTQEYRYHPAGWRLWNSNEGWYLYGPGGQLLTKSGIPSTDYVYFAGRLLFTMSEGSFDPRLTKLTRMYSDRLGSTRATTVLTYGWGSTTRNYYPFGEEIGSTANNEYKFASTYRDSATGLDYAVNRYYASGTARFTTPDPAKRSARLRKPGTWNRYTYGSNDPINHSDPLGLFTYEPVPCWWFGECDPEPEPDPEPDPVPPDPGSGGNPDPPKLKNIAPAHLSNTGDNQSAFIGSVNSLSKNMDSDCGDWLGKGLSSLIDELGNSDSNGSAMHADVTATYDDGSSSATSIAAYSNTAIPGVNIIVNDNGAFYSSSLSWTDPAGTKMAGGSARLRSFILLHEFGHILRAAGMRDEESDDDFKHNNELVLQKCGNTLAKF